MSTMTEDTTYNGWKNYPTWAVNLWLDNDEGLFGETFMKAEFAYHEASKHENCKTGIWSEDQTRRFMLADTLKDWVRDDLAPDLGPSFAADLLGYALDEVDWNEIADSWLEKVIED